MVVQLCKDYDNDYVEVNRQLDKMGYNIGMRLIEDFLAKSNSGMCRDFRETAEMISKVRSPPARTLEGPSVDAGKSDGMRRSASRSS